MAFINKDEGSFSVPSDKSKLLLRLWKISHP